MTTPPPTSVTGKKSAKRSRKAKARKRFITPEDLCRLIKVADPQIAHDGQRIVFVRQHLEEGRNKPTRNLWMAHPGAPNARRKSRTSSTTENSTPIHQFTSAGVDGHPRWSPDDSTIAFLTGRVEEGRMQIALIPSADNHGGEARILTKLPEGSIETFKWSPDGRLLAVKFREIDPDWTRKAVSERKEKGLTDPPRVLDDWWYRLDGDGYFNAQRYHLYMVDAATGAHRKIYDKDNLGMFSFDWSPDSKHLVIATNRDKYAMVRPEKDELIILNTVTGKWKSVPDLPPGPKDQPRWSPDGRLIAYAGRLGLDGTYSTENLELFVCDPVRGQARSLTGKEDYCLAAIALTDTGEASFSTNIRWSADSRRIFMQIGWHGETHIASVAARGGRIVFHTKGSFGHTMGNLSSDGQLMVGLRGSVVAPDDVFAFNINSDEFTATQVTAVNAGLLSQLAVSRPTSHWVKAEDGWPVHMWRMLPPGVHSKAGRTKKYPAVLEVHGGPHAMYGVGFFHEFQMLAASGRIVFYSNPRGSKGYGRDHCAAIRGSWGDRDWADVMAVTEFMQRDPSVNRKKIGIMGGSYGGYMTCWAIGHTRVFAGAISDRCVSNLVSMGGNSDFVDTPDRYWVGNVWDRTESRWNASPMQFMGKARTPTLIIHSEGDLRCNIEQSEEVFSSLKLLKVPTRFVRYPRSTSHGMSRNGPPDMRLHRLRQILEWWDRYL